MTKRDVARQLAQRLTEDDPPLRLRQAIVTVVTAPTLTVKIGGSSVVVPGVRYLASYSPVVNHQVYLLQQGPDLLVLGRLA